MSCKQRGDFLLLPDVSLRTLREVTWKLPRKRRVREGKITVNKEREGAEAKFTLVEESCLEAHRMWPEGGTSQKVPLSSRRAFAPERSRDRSRDSHHWPLAAGVIPYSKTGVSCSSRGEVRAQFSWMV